MPGFLPRTQVAIGIGYLVLFVGFSLWARFDVPYGDDWDWILAVLTGPGGLAGLLQPHNEHVIPLARLLMSAHLATGGLSGHLIQYVALGCQLAIIWMFWREVARRWPDRPAWRWTVGGLVLVCLSLTQQLQSVVFAAAVLFPLVQFWITLAVVAWLNADDAWASGSERQRLWWWCSAACVAGAVASTTSGIMAPAILGLMAWLRGGRAREVVGWGGVAVALAVAYLGWVGIGVPTDGSSAVRGAAIAMVLGAIVLAAIAMAGLSALRRRGDVARAEMFAIAQIVFGLACIAMVAPGRAQFGLMQAAQSRYATFVLCLLAALVLFVASRASRGVGTEAVRARPLVQWGALVLSVLLLVPNVYIGVLWWAKADTLNAAHLALRSGVPDPVWLKSLHPLPVVIERTVEVMASRGMPVVDAAMHTTIAPLPTTACPGEGRLVRQSRLGGMVFDGTWSSSTTRGVVIDGGDAVVGLTEPAPWVREPAPSPAQVHAVVMRELRGPRSSAPGARPWIGFAQAGRGGPYRWVGFDRTGASTCIAALTLTPSVHATLDRVDVDPGHVVHAAGWAFACGEDLAVWTLIIDAHPVDASAVTALARVPRPDVAAVFASACVPDGPAGVHLQVRPGVLSPGPHTATLRVVSASGAVGESHPFTFVVPAGIVR